MRFEFLALSGFIFLSSCQTGPVRPRVVTLKEVKPDCPPTPPAPPPASTEVVVPPQEIYQFIFNNLRGEPASAELLQRLQAETEQHQLREAALSIALIRDYLSQLDADEATPPSLEDMSLSAKINLPEVFSRNLVLRSYPAQKLALEAAKRNPEERFHKEMREVILHQTALFKGLFPAVVEEEGGGQVALEEPVAAVPAATSGLSPAIQYGGTNQRLEEALFVRVDKLVEDKEYKQAIKLLQSIGEDSMYRDAALDKIQNLSRLALNGLRSQAAEAFLKAGKMPDEAQQKREYLEQARLLLQQALEDYPEAESSQLQKVEKNLRIIEQRIQLLPEPPEPPEPDASPTPPVPSTLP